MRKINVVQFLPYYLPHKGGLEFHAYEWSCRWKKNDYGKVINVISSIGQYDNDGKILACYDKLIIDSHGQQIGYIENGIINYVVPSFEIIPTFICPKFWTGVFWYVLKKIHKDNPDIIITRTRFFLTSLCGGIVAKLMKKKWIHIEHGVAYVKLREKWKSMIAWLYDQLIGKIIFIMCNEVIAISQACRIFSRKFTNKNISVVYRGTNFIPCFHKKKNIDKNIHIGFIGRISNLKGVSYLIEAFSLLGKKYNTKNIKLHIVGDGEEKIFIEKQLQEYKLQNNVLFYGFREREFLQSFIPTMDIIVNPSFQEGLPSSVIEGLLSKCIVVATDVGGTKEISNKKDLILCQPGNVKDLYEKIQYAIKYKDILKGLSYEIVKEKFSRMHNIEKYYLLFVDILHEQK